jgi:hypothetical protein
MHTPADIFAQHFRRLIIVALLALGLLSNTPVRVMAQGDAPRKPAASNKKPAVAKPAAPAAPRDDQPAPEFSPEPTFASATSRPFLTGDEWQDTQLRFEQWLSIQTLYDNDQVQQMRTKYAARAKATSPADRKQFIHDVDAKLQILYSPRTLELERNFADRLSVAAPAYAKKTKQQLPDVLGSTPAQLRERLTRIALKYQSAAEVSQAFEKTRQDQLSSRKANTELRRFEQQGRPSAGQIASSSPGGNQRSRSGFAQARDYYPQTGSSITYSVIPAMPMMTTGGWAMFGGGVAISIQRNR